MQEETKEKAEAMFQDIGEAYEVLSDPGTLSGCLVVWFCLMLVFLAEKREKYNRGEDVFPNQQGGGGQQQHGFHGFPGNFHFKFNF